VSVFFLYKQLVLLKASKPTTIFNLKSESHKLEIIFLMLPCPNSYLSSYCSGRHILKEKRSEFLPSLKSFFASSGKWHKPRKGYSFQAIEF